MDSDRICKPCKRRLIENGQTTFQIYKKMFWQRFLFAERKKYQVYRSRSEIPRSLGLGRNMPCYPTVSELIGGLRIVKFLNLARVAVKVFCCERVSQVEVDKLSEIEKQLLVLILKKKRVYHWEDAEATYEFLEMARKNPVPKREEESVKFVLKKINRYLQGEFRKRLYYKAVRWLHPDIVNLNDEMSSFQYSYVGFYYESVACQTNLHIEAFFHPRMNQAFPVLKPNLIPKTISRLSVSLSRLSKKYKSDAKYYLERVLLDEVRGNIAFKLESMLRQWGDWATENGDQGLVRHLEKNFLKNSKAKLAWGVDQVREGIRQLAEMIKRIE